MMEYGYGIMVQKNNSGNNHLTGSVVARQHEGAWRNHARAPRQLDRSIVLCTDC
jgi:hypothetical protein